MILHDFGGIPGYSYQESGGILEKFWQEIQDVQRWEDYNSLYFVRIKQDLKMFETPKYWHFSSFLY